MLRSNKAPALPANLDARDTRGREQGALLSQRAALALLQLHVNDHWRLTRVTRRK